MERYEWTSSSGRRYSVELKDIWNDRAFTGLSAKVFEEERDEGRYSRRLVRARTFFGNLVQATRAVRTWMVDVEE